MNREIDRLVAEHVLGLQIQSDGRVAYSRTDDQGTMYVWFMGVKAYSEDIGVVFAEVIPAMREKGWHLTLSDAPKLFSDRVEQTWVARFQRKKEGALHFADSPAEAICLAALRAVGVEVEE